MEERYLKTAIEAKTTTHLVDNVALETALAAHARGETDDALQALAATVEESTSPLIAMELPSVVQGSRG